MSETAKNPFEPFFSEIRRIVKEEIRVSLSDLDGHSGEKWFFTSKEAAYLLGIPKSWLERAAKEAEAKAKIRKGESLGLIRVRFGHYKVFTRDALLQFAEEQKKKSFSGSAS